MFKLSSTFETRFSNYHKLVSTVLKSVSFKGTPKIKIFRSYKTFELENFNRILKDKLENLTNHSYAEFEKVFPKKLNKQAPLKKRRSSDITIMLLWQKNYGRKLFCGQNSKINLIKEEIISTGAIISVCVIIG